MKRCFKCGQEKPLSEFYRHPQMGDGHLNKCKSCTKTDVSENYVARHDQYVAYDKERSKTPKRRALADKCRDRTRVQNPEKYRARSAVSAALRTGRLTKQPCYVCVAEYVEAHHEDYSKPLDVVWLCPRHHRAVDLKKLCLIGHG